MDGGRSREGMDRTSQAEGTPHPHPHPHPRSDGASAGGTQCGPSPGPAMEQGVEKVTRSVV